MVPYIIDLVGTGYVWMSYGGDLVGASDMLSQKISAILHFQWASDIAINATGKFQGMLELTMGIGEMFEPAELTWDIAVDRFLLVVGCERNFGFMLKLIKSGII